jgi:hypothetical protein
MHNVRIDSTDGSVHVLNYVGINRFDLTVNPDNLVVKNLHSEGNGKIEPDYLNTVDIKDGVLTASSVASANQATTTFDEKGLTSTFVGSGINSTLFVTPNQVTIKDNVSQFERSLNTTALMNSGSVADMVGNQVVSTQDFNGNDFRIIGNKISVNAQLGNYLATLLESEYAQWLVDNQHTPVAGDYFLITDFDVTKPGSQGQLTYEVMTAT